MPAPFVHFPLLRSYMLLMLNGTYVHVMFMLLPSHFVLAHNDLTLHPEVKAQVLAGGRGLGYFKELTDTTRVVVFLVSLFGG